MWAWTIMFLLPTSTLPTWSVKLPSVGRLTPSSLWTSSAIAIGSETSGGIHHIYSDHITVYLFTLSHVFVEWMQLVPLGSNWLSVVEDTFMISTMLISNLWVFSISLWSTPNTTRGRKVYSLTLFFSSLGYTGTVLPQLDTISIRDVHGFASVLPGLLEVSFLLLSLCLHLGVWRGLLVRLPSPFIQHSSFLTRLLEMQSHQDFNLSGCQCHYSWQLPLNCPLLWILFCLILLFQNNPSKTETRSFNR